MKMKIATLASIILLLAISVAANQQLAVVASTQTVHINPNNGPQTSLVSAFCSNTPCTITWFNILSNSNVGAINNTSGPQTTFTVGTEPGTAYIFVSDGSGHTAQVQIFVVQ